MKNYLAGAKEKHSKYYNEMKPIPHSCINSLTWELPLQSCLKQMELTKEKQNDFFMMDDGSILKLKHIQQGWSHLSLLCNEFFLWG